uniref:Palmitoyltransferase n=1 Tax=Steinernema glaseri TaxID=37863 RepID=A0A1I7ZH86_9BILA
MDGSCESLPLNYYHVLLGFIVGQLLGIMIWVMFGFAFRFTLYDNVYVMDLRTKKNSQCLESESTAAKTT